MDRNDIEGAAAVTDPRVRTAAPLPAASLEVADDCDGGRRLIRVARALRCAALA
jgi:hypothetical protein